MTDSSTAFPFKQALQVGRYQVDVVASDPSPLGFELLAAMAVLADEWAAVGPAELAFARGVSWAKPAELATALGVPEALVLAWEAGITPIGAHERYALADLLNKALETHGVNGTARRITSPSPGDSLAARVAAAVAILEQDLPEWGDGGRSIAKRALEALRGVSEPSHFQSLGGPLAAPPAPTASFLVGLVETLRDALKADDRFKITDAVVDLRQALVFARRDPRITPYQDEVLRMLRDILGTKGSAGLIPSSRHEVLDTYALVVRRAFDPLDAADVRAIREMLRELGPLVRPSIVHLMHEGLALCRKPGVPGNWDDGDTWVRLEDANQANCGLCLLSFKGEP